MKRTGTQGTRRLPRLLVLLAAALWLAGCGGSSSSGGDSEGTDPDTDTPVWDEMVWGEARWG